MIYIDVIFTGKKNAVDTYYNNLESSEISQNFTGFN